MRASRDELPLAMSGPGYESRQAEWGDMHVARERCDVTVDLTEPFRALPDGRCPCPHWGYVVTGSITFRYADGDLVAAAGQVYYARPGHIPVAAAGSEIVEFSPAAAYRECMAHLAAG